MMSLYRGRLAFFVGVLAVLVLAEPPVRPAAPTDQSELKPIYAALREEPALRGTWVTASRVGGKWMLRLAVDEGSSGDAQQVVLTGFINATLRGRQFEITPEVERFPVTRLLSTIQDRIDGDPLLQGCLIKGAYFGQAEESDFTKRIFKLYGRIRPSGSSNFTEQRQARIKALCDSFLDKESVWRGLKNKKLLLVDQQGELQVTPLSERAKESFYKKGLDLFRAEEYAKAAAAFRLTLTENPDDCVVLYWWAAAEIKKGDLDKASQLIHARIVQDRKRHLQGDPQVSESLERLQGPTRYLLERLEEKAWRDFGDISEPSSEP